MRSMPRARARRRRLGVRARAARAWSRVRPGRAGGGCGWGSWSGPHGSGGRDIVGDGVQCRRVDLGQRTFTNFARYAASASLPSTFVSEHDFGRLASFSRLWLHRTNHRCSGHRRGWGSVSARRLGAAVASLPSTFVSEHDFGRLASFSRLWLVGAFEPQDCSGRHVPACPCPVRFRWIQREFEEAEGRASCVQPPFTRMRAARQAQHPSGVPLRKRRHLGFEHASLGALVE